MSEEVKNKSEYLVEVRDLKQYFPIKTGFMKTTPLKAVDGVSFSIKPGETLGLVGESGCGKTTVGRSLLRLYTPTSGDVFFDGERVDEKSIGHMRRQMQMVFQDPYTSLDPKQKVGDILMETLEIHGIGSKKDRLDIAMEIMGKVGLRPEHFYRYPHEFSGGQRQRVGLARALILNPKVIVCDEPVSALDVSIQSQVLNLLRQLQESMGMAYIFISHNLSVIKHISDRVMVMYLGHVVELADKKELFANPSHPYTQALLSAIPVPERHSKRKKIILQGDLPSPANPPSGCIFHTRCFMAQEICSTQKPELRDIGGGHLCACHFCNGACAQNGTTEEK